MAYIRKLYSGELSQIENLVVTLRQGQPLNALAPFKKYEYIVEETVRSNYQEVLIQFELGVGMSFKAVQAIKIPGSEEMLEELRAIKGTKIVRDSIVPINLSFTPNQLLLVKKIIDDVITAEAKSKKDAADAIDAEKKKKARNNAQSVR